MRQRFCFCTLALLEADTEILAGHTFPFPSQVIELPIASSAPLLYSVGEMTAAYQPVSDAKLSTSGMSTNAVQVVEPIINSTTNPHTNEEAVSAPAATIGLAAAGAALPPLSLVKSP